MEKTRSRTKSSLDRVRQLLAWEIGGKEAPEFEPTHRLQEDLGCDSLDVIELTMAVEEEFGIWIDDEEGEALRTVQDVVDLAERKLGEKGS